MIKKNGRKYFILRLSRKLDPGHIDIGGVRVMVLSATFNNISAIS